MRGGHAMQMGAARTSVAGVLRRWPWHALTAVLFWGLSFIATRVALEAIHPFALVWTRLALGAALLFGVLRARGEPWLVRREDRGAGVVLGLLLGGHLLIQAFAMQLTTAMRAGWLIAFVPVTIALGAALFRREHLGARGWIGVAVASSGVLVLTAVRPADFARAGTGDWMLLGSSLTWAAYTLISIETVARNGALRVTAFAMAVAVVPNLLASFAAGQLSGPLSARVVAAQLFLGLFSSGIAMWAWNASLRELGAHKSSAVLYAQPFVTLAASIALLGEPITVNALLGGPIVLAGVWLLRRSRSTT